MSLTRRSLLKTGAAAIAAPLVAASQRQRNLLMIAADDLNNCLGTYGHRLVRTPNIDRIARQGVRFDRAYCQFPLCSPSRSSLLTGLSPDSTGVYDLQKHFRSNVPDVVTLPQLFMKNGYFTARAGKMFHYGVPGGIGTSGLDDPPSWNKFVNPNGVDHTKEEALLTNYTPTRGLGSAIAFHASASPEEEHTDAILAEAVIAMMEENRNKPFFIGAGFYRPHVPWIVPVKYFDLFPLDKIQETPFDESEMQSAPELAYFTRPANWGLNPLQRREAIRAYYASIAFLDAQVGKLLHALDRLKLADNTTIAFWSDHGYHLGDHGQWMKQSLFENSARAPLIIGGAGVAARGHGCARTVELLDLYPTLAEHCGLQGAPTNLQGRSLKPLLAKTDAAWDKPAITQTRRNVRGQFVMGYSLRTERRRYTQWGPDGSLGEELYDYQADPRELRNLAKEPQAEPERNRLRTRLSEILRSRPRVTGG